MDQRQDAMLAAAKFTVAVNEAVRAEPGAAGRDRGPRGRVAEHANVIPGACADGRPARPRRREARALPARFEQLRARSAGDRTTFASRRAVDSEPAIADSAA